MSNFTIHVQYMNGSSNELPFISALDAREYARDKISYSGSRIARVSLADRAGGSCETLWQHDWNSASKHAGLHIWL